VVSVRVVSVKRRTIDMAADKWISKAISHPGALTKKAHKAGESPMEFARSHEHAKGKTGKQARLAVTLSKMHK
jgi:hypothetical protein